MKKYFKKIFDILFVKKESMGYIEKDNKKHRNIINSYISCIYISFCKDRINYNFFRKK